VLADWKVEQHMVLKRHPDYFRKGQPYVDELVLRVIPDEANIVAARRTGQIHHAFIEGFRQHPTTMLYGFEGAWLDKA
jgi:ABC-type transport system substrate-binding protein